MEAAKAKVVSLQLHLVATLHKHKLANNSLQQQVCFSPTTKPLAQQLPFNLQPQHNISSPPLSLLCYLQTS